LSNQKKGKIPIAAAKRISEDAGQDMVIVFGLSKPVEGDEAGGKFQITTYGKTKLLCKLAASLADQIVNRINEGLIAPPDEEPAHGGTPICIEKHVD
jgi:hypothetical protein